MKKYKLTNNTKVIDGVTLYQIEALMDFSHVKTGELGGYIQSERNLSQNGNAWIYDDKSYVFGNARVFGNVMINCCNKIHGNAKICGSDVYIIGGVEVCDNAIICSESKVLRPCKISKNAMILDRVVIETSLDEFATRDYKDLLKS